MQSSEKTTSPTRVLAVVAAMIGLIAVPAALTLHTVRVQPVLDANNSQIADPSPYGYTVSLLLFLFPIVALLLWIFPREGVSLHKRAFLWTIGVLFPVGAGLDFFFAHLFFTYGNPAATLGITAPALGSGVPAEEYAFYLFGFVADLLLYVWLDAYWLAAYSVPVTERIGFERLLRFHPWSLIWAIVLIAVAILYRKAFVLEPGFPGYFLFLVLAAMLPSTALLPEAKPVINWRALSLTMMLMLLISLIWEVTLGLPYHWWGFRPQQMIGIHLTAWSGLPIEEVFLWVTVTYATVIFYEIIRRWKVSGRSIRDAFLG
jgi:hypothetical protein